MKTAIVLSGGGGKGAYQIGVWKALKKLGINYQIVTGTSVGALNGALMTQKDFDKALKLWQDIDFKTVFSEEDAKILDENFNNEEVFKTYLRKIVKGGMKPTNLEKLIRETINPSKIKNNNIKLGIVTVNYKNLQPLNLVINEVEENKIADYLLASASCFPFFQKKEIDNQFFIDGGFHDNLPINLAIEMGAERIIAVDLDAIGLQQEVKKDIPITLIKVKNDVGNFLVFDKEKSKKAIIYGYNDTMKAFNKLEGNTFTFKRFSLHWNFLRRKQKLTSLLKEIYNYDDTNHFFDDLIKEISLRINKDTVNNLELSINYIMEYLGKVLDLDDTLVYRSTRFNKCLLEKKNTEINSLKFKNIERILKLIKKKDFAKVLQLSLIYKEDCLAAIYLYVIGW